MLIAEELLLLLLDEDSGKQSGWVHAVDPALEGALRLDAELGATTPSGDGKVVERDERKAAEARAKAIAASGPVGDHVAAKVREEVNQMVMTAVFAATTTAATTTTST